MSSSTTSSAPKLEANAAFSPNSRAAQARSSCALHRSAAPCASIKLSIISHSGRLIHQKRNPLTRRYLRLVSGFGNLELVRTLNHALPERSVIAQQGQHGAAFWRL